MRRGRCSIDHGEKIAVAQATNADAASTTACCSDAISEYATFESRQRD